MNLDKFIKMKMIQLNAKYIISLIEVSTVKENRIHKSITFNYRKLNESPTKNRNKRFYNKRELVSWLSCLE